MKDNPFNSKSPFSCVPKRIFFKCHHWHCNLPLPNNMEVGMSNFSNLELSPMIFFFIITSKIIEKFHHVWLSYLLTHWILWWLQVSDLWPLRCNERWPDLFLKLLLVLPCCCELWPSLYLVIDQFFFHMLRDLLQFSGDLISEFRL